MTEDRRRHDHLRVVAALEHFEIGPARQGRLDAEAHFTRFERRRVDVFNTNVFFPVEDSGFHRTSLGLKEEDGEGLIYPPFAGRVD